MRDAARAAWLAQRDADDGCALLAATLFDAKQFSAADVWRKARLAVEAGRPRAARQAARAARRRPAAGVAELQRQPGALPGRAAPRPSRGRAAELAALALMRLAAHRPRRRRAAARRRAGTARLPPDLAAWAWAASAKQAALKLQPEAADALPARRDARPRRDGAEPDWPDETLAWKVRAALRADDGAARWQQVRAGDRRDERRAEQRDPAWVYWKARALQALAAATRRTATRMRAHGARAARVASPAQLHFYGKLAAEDLGRPLRAAAARRRR